jgi:cyclophilin family peptidyl-prolyl cis-trans isomerase/HEAT repeat protein
VPRLQQGLPFAGWAAAAALLSSCTTPADAIRALEHRRDASGLAAFADLPDPATRRAAARALGRVQSWASADALIAMTRDPDVRREAVFALGQLGFAETDDRDAAARIVAHLIATLPRSAETVEAVGKLGRIAADEARPWLVEAASHPEAPVRAQAASALMRLTMERPERHAQVADALIALARDGDADVRTRAAYALGRPAEPRAVDVLAAMTGDADRWCRLFAVRGLGRLKARPDAIAAACADPDDLVRAEAVAAAGAAGVPVPEAAYRDPCFHVRAAAVRAAGPEADWKAFWNDPSRTVRLEAVSLLGRRKDSARLAGLASHPDDFVRARVAAAVSELEVLRTLAADPAERVAAAAVEALGPREEAEAWTVVVAALRHPGISVRGGAISALGTRKEARALAPLAECYEASMSREWIEAREGIVDAVAEIEGGRALLEGIATADPAPSVRARAARALGRPVEPRVQAPDRPDLLRSRFARNPRVWLETDKGTMILECFAEEAPAHVASFVSLVERGFYDGLTFHRVVPNFVIQGGDPRGDGWGDAGYNLRDEINAIPYVRGVLGMPKAGKDTGGCQIFLTHTPTPHLDGRYTVFGRVTDGDETIDKIEIGDKILRARVIRP